MAKRSISNGQPRPRRSNLTVDDVAAEARTLRELFAHFGSLELRPVQFEPDESPLVRAFWESFGGWSPFFLSHLEPPELEHARRSMPAQLADFRRSGCRLKLTDLPARFRCVEIDSQGLGMLLTDEGSGPDPIIIELICDKSKLTRTKATYLRTCAKDLLELAMRRMYRTTLSLDEEAAFPAVGAPLLPKLANEVCQLGDGIWRLANDYRSIVLAHASTDALIAWLEAVDLPSFSLGTTFCGEHVNVKPGLETEFETIRKTTDKHGIVTRIGRLADTKFIHVHAPPERFITGDSISINPRLYSHIPTAWKRVSEERPRNVSGEFCVSACPTAPPYDAGLAGARTAAVDRLRAVLNACVPEHTQAEAPGLEPGTPGAIAEFWQLIGWGDWMRGIIPTHPSQERDLTAVRRLLSRWMQEAKIRDRWHLDPGTDPLTYPCFPKRLRSVYVAESSPRHDGLATTGGTWMILADESDNTDDPAVFEVPPSAPRRDYLPWRYTSYVARKLIAGLMRQRSVAGWPPPANASRTLLPVLPDVCEMAPGVWCRSFETHTANMEPLAHEFLFASMGSLVAFALSVPAEDFVRLGWPRHSSTLVSIGLSRAKASPAHLEKLGLRVARHKDNSGHDECIAAGTLAGCPVLVSIRHQIGLSLAGEAADADRLKEWATEQGFGVRIR